MKELIRLDSVRDNGFLQTVSDKGRTTIKFQKAGEFKETYKEKFPDSTARERKLAFERYVREQSLALAKTIDMSKMIELIAAGKLGVKRMGLNKSGDELTTVFIDLSASANTPIAKEAIEAMNEESLKELLEYIQGRLAKDVDSAKNDFAALLKG